MTADNSPGQLRQAADLPATRSTWAALRHDVFRKIWIATVASNVGTWMQDVGNSWLMTSLSSSPLDISLVQAANSLPLFLLALPAGALADIVDRRRILLFAQLWMLAAATGIGLLTISGDVTPAILLTFTALIGVGTALAAPAFQAIVPELVPPEDLQGAIGLNALAINLSRSVGPALGGLVVGAFGPGVAFLLNAVSFLGVAAVIFSWKREPQPSALPAERLVAAIRAGARYVLHSRPLRTVLLRNFAFMIGASALWALLPVVAREEMQLGPFGYGALLGCIGVGALVAVNVTPFLRQKTSSDGMVAIAAVCFGVATLGLSLIRTPLFLVPFLLMAGAGWVMTLGTLNVAAQKAVPSWARSRALAAYLLVWFGTTALGSILWGAIAARYGSSVALTFAAVVIALSMLTALRFRLSVVDLLDLTPARHWDAPQIAVDVQHDHGPILVQVEYRVAEEKIPAFLVAVRSVRDERLRDGAINWTIYRDLAAGNRFIEQFVVESWLEHLRQHERVSRHDAEAQSRVRDLTLDPSIVPIVTHSLAIGVCTPPSLAVITPG
jgi:MFS family permease